MWNLISKHMYDHNGADTLTEDFKPAKDNMQYPYQGVLPPIKGKGKPIYFKVADKDSYNELVELANAAYKVNSDLEKEKRENGNLKLEIDTLRRKLDAIPKAINASDINEQLVNRVKYLEECIKDQTRHTMILYPISFFQEKEGEGPPLTYEAIAERWLKKARIELEPGEKIEPKRYYVSFTNTKSF